MNSPIPSQWRIIEMPMFNIEMFDTPMLWLHDEQTGFLKFCGMEAGVDYQLSERDGKPFIEFTWWEPHRLPHCGRGWASIDGHTLQGKIYMHAGDHSDFKAVQVGSDPNEDSVKAILRHGPITVDPTCTPSAKAQSRRKPVKQQSRKSTTGQGSRKVRGPIPDKVRKALKERLEQHIATNWDHTLVRLILRYRAAYAYVDVQDPTQNFPIHLCRLGYLGELEKWEFAFYKYSDEVYEKSRDWSGSFITTPEQAFDVAATVYLADNNPPSK